MPRWIRPLAATAIATALTACGSSTSTPPTHPAASLHVLSSISDGATLADAVAWTAQPVGLSGSDSVAKVEFSIDGKVLWTSPQPPYVFGLEHPVAKRLFPWIVGSGAHRFSVRLVTVAGKTAATSAQAKVVVTSSVPPAVVGTFSRHVTKADIKRTQPFRNESPDQVLPPGVWKLHVAKDGLINFDDPMGGGGNEAFVTSAAGKITLMGPANWLSPPDRQGAFCELEPETPYDWTAHGGTLTLTPHHDTCADRNAMFAGRWTRQ